MEPQERAVAPSHWLGDEAMSRPEGGTEPSKAGNQRRDGIKTDEWRLQRSQHEALHLDFQDSNLSPALQLLPSTSGLQHSATDYSLYQQSYTGFAPLRAFPDVSIVSERVHSPIHDRTTHSSEQGSLYQHPLAQETLLSEEGAKSVCSPSQQSISTEKNQQQEEMAHPLPSDAKVNAEEIQSIKCGGYEGQIHEDETNFLSKDPQNHLEASKGTMYERQGPPGEAGPSQRQRKHQEISNITIGSRRTQPDDSSEELHRELLSEARRLSSVQANKEPEGLPPNQQSTTPSLEEPQAKPSGKPFSGGSGWIYRKRDLLSSQNHAGSDSSYLGLIPLSQSTPGFFSAPLKFNSKAKLEHLSAIEANKEILYDSSVGPESVDGRLPNAADQQAHQASDRVRSLPSLNYLQKVDAWRTKQSSERTPPLEGLELDAQFGVSPKKKDDKAQSKVLNQNPTHLGSQDTTQIPSSAPSPGSSPRRGEAVGGAPGDLDNKGSAAPPSASPFGRSQSLSSISTVVMSVDKPQQTNGAALSQTDASPPSTATEAPPLHHFNHVSVDPELSSSQDSYREIKLGPSVGTSSVVSLELDNYAPYWTHKRPTSSPPPSGSKELNIDERIPLYLQNLGIDQTPSKILTPFVPRGPIREPEFSPTDLCTIKGSSGTPSKSTQPSEGSSPYKGEFSRSSILSVDSSISIPFSLDSLGPAASVSEQVRVRASSPHDTEVLPRESRAVSCHQSDERSHSSILHNSKQQQGESESTSVSGKIVDTDRKVTELPSCRNLDQDGESSFVSERALSEIRKLLSQAENIISTGSSTASSGANTSRLCSDTDLFKPPEIKTSKLQTSLLSSSSSTGGDLKSHSTLPWARSSSDSMLLTEKPQQSSAAHEGLTSPGRPDNPASPAACIPVGNGAGTSKPPRRTEPEGCSAAPPDKIPIQPSTAADTQQLNLTSADIAGEAEEEEKVTPSDAGAQSRSSSPVHEDANQEVLSDGSSENSLTIRVAKLLQKESPVTMASSSPSVTDQEEGKTKEGMMSKVWERQGEPLQLDEEDRRRIEEIKKELLLRNPLKSQGSTDTDGSIASSTGITKKDTEAFSTLNVAKKQLGLSAARPEPHTHHNILHLHLEARVCEIAAREGLALPTKRVQPLSSISVSTDRPSVTPSSSSPFAPPLSSSSQALHLPELPSGTVRSSSSIQHLLTDETEAERLPSARTTTKQPSVSEESKQNQKVSQKSSQDQEPPPTSQALEEPDVRAHAPKVQTGSFSPSHKENQAFKTSRPPNLHFTLLPKSTANTSVSAIHRHDAVDFAAIRGSPPAASSPDEGVGSSSPADWCRLDASTAAQRKGIPASSPSLTQQRRSAALTALKPAYPVLLPYKPRGSEELFYVPQTEADVSSSNQSDTSMESTHTGSDDAVPPRFNSEVLGDQDPGLDRGIAIRHKEGIYSRRLRTFRMEDRGQNVQRTLDHIDASEAAIRRSSAFSPTAKPSSQESIRHSVSGAPSTVNTKASKRDQGTSPIQFLHYKQAEPTNQRFHPAQTEDDRLPPPPQQSSDTLDHLWQRFCDEWNREEPHPTRDKEAILERLEHLSRLIQNSYRGPGYYVPVRTLRDREEVKRTNMGRKVGDAEKETYVSNIHNQPFPSADRDQPERLSTVSGSTSTMNTARLIRAFGADRVKHLRSNSNLSKLYSAINKQREERERRKGTKEEDSVTLTPSATTCTDQSVLDTASTSSTISPPHGPSRALTTKRAARTVNKCIQAGELEIVRNGTRRHTRDVGTTFPSPGEAGAFERISSSSSSTVRGRGGGRRLIPKSNNSQKQKKSKRSPSKPYPKGVSWFISVDNLRSETRKENRPEEPSTAWFEPYSQVRPWREPLRQRQVYEDSSNHPEQDPHPESKTFHFGLLRVTLQEALEMRRPEFICQSKQRVRRLALQAEERRLQATLGRDRRRLYNHPGELGRLLKSAGNVMLRRAVPRKEMIQRSKQIYENLPEVRRRREEERRKAEYQSYRLNAQLFNKRITNRVLGRRTAWH
ncbi:mucin-17 isoform X2 [Cyprinodon tularosa]|uniref:mucin-17 isoform X2 n=1 Tax=Cyprinodon tularosa TaxID=77115 RepID=UPI0018E21E0F|nr:mucin-17 isoform X2 [Cyprinodon tularosa]